MNYFNYFSDIEEAFVRRRGRHLLLNPKDWALMEEWESRGVPLHIVIRAVNDVFDLYDKRPGFKREVASLSYCKSEVEAGFAEWTDAQVGSSETGDGRLETGAGITIEGVLEHIDGALESLGKIYRKDIEGDLVRACSRLRELRDRICRSTTPSAEAAATPPGQEGSFSFEAVDKVLNDIEKDLDAAMLVSWKRTEFEPIEKWVAAQMEEYRATMDPDAYDRTSTLLLLDRLRKVSGVPRLSLFSM